MTKLSIEFLQSEWAKDASFDRTELAIEQARTPILHSKYLNWYFDENMILLKKQADYDKKYLEAWEALTQGQDLEWGDKDWPPSKGRITKKDEILAYMNANSELVKMKLSIALTKQKIEFINEVIKQLNQRNYQIKNIIDWEKFKNPG